MPNSSNSTNNHKSDREVVNGARSGFTGTRKPMLEYEDWVISFAICLQADRWDQNQKLSVSNLLMTVQGKTIHLASRLDSNDVRGGSRIQVHPSKATKRA